MMIEDENNSINELNVVLLLETEELYISIREVNEELNLLTEDIAKQIVSENTLLGVLDLTHLFNVAQVKKQVIRNLTYNLLLDKITNLMDERLVKRADQFSNKDLLDYAKIVLDGIDKALKHIYNIDTSPAIQVNTQNNIVINPTDELDRDSRQRIMEAAKAAMELIMLQGSDVTLLILSKVDNNLQENLNFNEEDIVLTIDDELIEDDNEEVFNLYNPTEK